MVIGETLPHSITTFVCGYCNVSTYRYVSEFESVLHEGAGARNQEELTERLVRIFY